MKIFIGADHRGFELKAKIVKLLKSLGHTVEDVGTYDKEACDYPEFSLKVARGVISNEGSRGILVCMSGIGHTIAANKVKGVYAALCYNKDAAMLSRQHNNANVLVLSAKYVPRQELDEIIKICLSTEFEGGRHERRINKIKEIEEGLGIKE